MHTSTDSNRPGPTSGPLTIRPIARPFRRFRVECECDAAPFVWEGDAISEQAAIRCAAFDLAVRCPEVRVDQVRATVCIEVTA